MSFLAPFFLVGGLALALPVVFHLIRRITRERTVFSSLLFLDPTPPRLTRRSRLENWLLLALRCLVLALLALGFARPFLKDRVAPPDPEGSAVRTVILIDSSASMRRPELWKDAVSRVTTLLGESRSIDEVSILAFGRDVRAVFRFDEWKSAPVDQRASLALGRLKDLGPDWSSTQLGAALVRAAETLAEADVGSAATRRRIVLYSDFQEGARLELLQGYEWPKEVQLVLEPVKPKSVGNAGLQLVAESNAAEIGTNPVVRVRVSNSPDATKDRFQVGWLQSKGAEFAGKPIEVYVPAGQSRVVTVPTPVGFDGLSRIQLHGDVTEFDNSIAVIPPEVARSRILYLGNENENETRQPLYFLKRAFPPTRRQTFEVAAVRSGDSLSAAEIQSAALVLVTDSLPEDRARLLREQMLAGMTVVAAPRAVGMAGTLARLTGVEGLSLTESTAGRYAILSELDFRHPLLGAFSDPRFSDFSKIHFWKHRRVDLGVIPGARAVAKFDSGAPALVEIPAGKGRLLLLTSCWHPEDSQLALSTKFVPLLFSMLEMAGNFSAPPSQYLVGDTIPLGVSGKVDGALSVVGPDGKAMTLPAGTTQFTAATQPGIYSVQGVQPVIRFGVNLDPSESRTAPIALDELERLGAPVTQATDPKGERAKERIALMQSAEAEGRQKLWRWFLVAALALLLVETVVAGWTARRTSLPEGAAT